MSLAEFSEACEQLSEQFYQQCHPQTYIAQQ